MSYATEAAEGDYAEAMAEGLVPVQEPEEVRVGMLLAVEEPKRGAMTEPWYYLWAVKSVRKLKNSDASVTLIRAIDCGSVEATARFPGGKVSDPFRHWLPSRKDIKHVYDRLGEIKGGKT